MPLATALTRRSINRGDVHWVDFGQPQRRALFGVHPAIVISPDDHNAKLWNSLVRVIPLTTPRRAPREDEMVIEPLDHGLCSSSLVRVVQARAVDRNCVLGRIGHVTDATMRKIELLLLKTNGIETEQPEDTKSENGSGGGELKLTLTA
jgi:mRNA interferase MazF